MNRKMSGMVRLLAVVFGIPGAVSQVQGQATITAVVRQVAHQSAGANWATSKVGTQLGSGAAVRTGKRAKCEVKLGPNIIRMSERSHITLRGNQIALDSGKLYGDFKQDTIIRGGKTTATIKGTKVIFWIEDTPDGPVLRVECLEGGPVTFVLPKLDLNGDPVPGEEVEIQIGAGESAELPTEGLRPSADGTYRPQDRVSTTGNTPSFMEASAGKTSSDFDATSGVATLVTPGARDSVAIKLARLVADAGADSGGDASQKQAAAAVLAQAIQNVVVRPPQPPSPGDLEPPTPTGGLDVTLRQPSVTRQRKQGFLAPRLDGNTFLYKRSGSRATYGLRLQESGLYSGVFWQFALSPQTIFDGNTDVDISDAFTVFRNPDTFGDVVIGRHRFLKGPVQNVTTGTLINQEIMDAVTWSPPIRTDPRWSLDLSLIQDAYPFDLAGNQGGLHVRAQHEGNAGNIGFNVMRINGIAASPSGRTKTGSTVDVAFPLFPDKLDIYGEFGIDVFGQNIQTFGWYFPHLYSKWNIDAYLETTKAVGQSPGISVLRLYYSMGPRLTALVTADKIKGQGGVNMGLGLVARLSR